MAPEMSTVEQARKAAAAIATAATRVGAPDPTEAVRHIEAEPTEIGGFAKVLNSALSGFDQALTSAGTARNTMTASSRGQAADLAEADANTRIEAANRGRERVSRLGAEVGGIAEKLETFQRQAAGQITAVANAAAPAAGIVLTGPDSPEYPGAARKVVGAVQGVLAAARTYQDQVEDARGQFGQAFGSGTDEIQLARGKTNNNMGKIFKEAIESLKDTPGAEELGKEALDQKDKPGMEAWEAESIRRIQEKLLNEDTRDRTIEAWEKEKSHPRTLENPDAWKNWNEWSDEFHRERTRLLEEAILEDASARARELGLPNPTEPAGGSHAARDGRPDAGR